jgi:hypothetical protein
MVGLKQDVVCRSHTLPAPSQCRRWITNLGGMVSVDAYPGKEGGEMLELYLMHPSERWALLLPTPWILWLDTMIQSFSRTPPLLHCIAPCFHILRSAEAYYLPLDNVPDVEGLPG